MLSYILVKANGILIGTPTYFDNVSALLKNFMDRTDPLSVGKKLKKKTVGLIVTGAMPEVLIRKTALKILNNFCAKNHEMIVKERLVITAYKKGEVQKNKKALTSIRKLGEKIVKSIK